MIRIPKYQFYLITLLILLLPLSSSWRLLIFGEKTKGVVMGVRKVIVKGGLDSPASLERTSIIRFTSGDKYYEFTGPGEIIYPAGKEITVFYNPRNPEKFLMFNFAGLFLSEKMIIPGVLLIIWAAFYFTVTGKPAHQQSKKRLQDYKRKLYPGSHFTKR